MKLSKMNETRIKAETVDTFGGLNMNPVIGDGEFSCICGMTNDSYPALKTCDPVWKSNNYLTKGDGFSFNGVLCSDGVVYTVQGDSLYADDTKIDGITLTNGRKRMLMFGAYLLIFPDAVYYNTKDSEDMGVICKSVEYNSGDNLVDFRLQFKYPHHDNNKNKTVESTADEDGYITAPRGLLSCYENEQHTAYIGIDPGEVIGGSGDKHEMTYIAVPRKSGESPYVRHKYLYDATRTVVSNGSTVQETYVAHAWETIKETRVKIYANGIGIFAEGASIDIRPLAGMTGSSKSIDRFLEIYKEAGTRVIKSYHNAKQPQNDYIVVDGCCSCMYEEASYYTLIGTTKTKGIMVTDFLPTMDYIVESGNRLWGCRYGENLYGDFVNEIYASALGDFKEWRLFEGTSMDSYTASVGTEGAFTAATTFNGNPVFFKENVMHRVYGNYPAQYQIQATPCIGVAKGADETVGFINNNLYYLSEQGVCMFDGSLPVVISEKIRDMRYKLNARKPTAGVIRGKYYLSCVMFPNIALGLQRADFPNRPEEDLRLATLVYDTKLKTWLIHDCEPHEFFYTKNMENGEYLFGIHTYIIGVHKQEDKELVVDAPYSATYEDELKTEYPSDYSDQKWYWCAVTGTYGLSEYSKKYISRFNVNLSLAKSTEVCIDILYDGGDRNRFGEVEEASWQRVWKYTSDSDRSMTVPIRPKRCKRFKIRLSGFGWCEIYSITRFIEEGGEA